MVPVVDPSTIKPLRSRNPEVGEHLPPNRVAYGAGVRGSVKSSRHETVPFRTWSLRIPEPKTGPLNLRDYPFQEALYGEEVARAQEVVVKKATQVGVSAWLLRQLLYWADVRGLTSLYVFPKLKQMFDFSDARIKSVIDRSEYLRERIPPRSVQNKGLKQVGPGLAYFRGSESEDDLDSVDADVLGLDEYDRLMPKNIPVAERRISNSTLALMRRVGVPTIPNFGISRLYALSDKRRWVVRCRGCGSRQTLKWPESIDFERRIRVCRKCRRPIDVRVGEWVAENPERMVTGGIGFHLSKLVVPRANVGFLIANSEKKLPEERQAFWNRDMAEAYAPKEGRLTDEAIAAAQSMGESLGGSMQAGYSGLNLVTAGIDVATVRNLHVRVSEWLDERRKRTLWVGEVESFDEAAKIIDRYQVSMFCVDHLPDGRLARALCERYPGRGYVINFADQRQADVMKVDEDRRQISVRRVEAIDAMMDEIRAQRNALPPEGLEPEHYTDHLKALMRIAERDDLGRRRVRYEHNGAFDYAMAETYDTVAGEAWFYRQATDEARRGSLTNLDDMMEFERSAVSTGDDVYRAGGDDFRYSEGFREEGLSGADDAITGTEPDPDW